MSELKKILLVEDEVDLREILALVLESEIDDVEIEEVSSGNEAIKFLEENTVSLIISDYTMFDGTGGDLFNHLKKINNQIPFLLLTGGYIEDYPEFKDSESVSFFEGVHYKPFDSDKLIALVNEVLARSGSENSDSPEENKSIEYFQLPIEVFEKVSYLHINVFTKIGEAKYVKIISDTDENPLEQFVHFKQKDIKEIYILKSDLSKYLVKAQEFLINKFSKNAKVMEKMEFGDFIFEFSKVALDFVGVTEQVYSVVNDQVEKISKNISKSKDLSKLLKETSDSQNYLSSHCIMTAYLGVHILKRMNMGEPGNLKKMIVSSLFHDISLSDNRLARIHHITDDLSAADKKIVMNHMAMSCEFIEKIVKVGEEDIFNIIKSHHERPDGSGFPKGINYKTIQPLTAVFILAHEAIRFVFESDHNMPGMNHALSKFDDSWKQGVFEKPFKALLSSLEENESD